MVDRRKSRSDKKKVVAALLCLFIGPFGVHRFYVGKVFTGILMIVFALLIPLYVFTSLADLANLALVIERLYHTSELDGLWVIWIWAIIDFVRIIKGSFGDKENRGLS